ncbi:hypothetical protein HETIRDRAFT_433327 [Heterobasidion irregulare TC 32-1]|uniref:Uncharacterized protein n=1 Tax=Heterobasidion irregulare (strain TC 32-1) TaxID=747525 RepID=W4KGU6_HETIT|nr:uncharacterized protein HETIRDRAFT_433327 [Heterobasidion irregulare TC 32-1]ETW84540.1 hypothetical protein HETIRDRAFT_433327 [Heterobasidion irregulare TC 32-1]
MASLSSRPPQLAPDPLSTRASDWGRADGGSAFRGLGRHARGARGGERGRGGRAGSRVGGGTAYSGGLGGRRDPSDTALGPADSPHRVKTETSSPAAPGTPASTVKSTSAVTPSSMSAKDLPAKPKPASRRASLQPAARKLPSLTIEPASPTANSFNPPSSTATSPSPRASGRRKRSHQPKSSTSVPKPRLSVDPPPPTTRAQKPKAFSGPSSPRSSKDAPPHLSADPAVATFDIKSHIDSLVERARAIAMENRPTTPGSHLDWAGDDDDTLPDLDDWGITSTAASSGTLPTSASDAGKLELMSPILDDSLKQLPIPDERAKSPVVEAARLSPNLLPAAIPGPRGNGRLGASGPNGVSRPNSGRLSPVPRSPNLDNGRSTKPPALSTAKLSPRLPLHPSLPPKPVSPFNSAGPKSPRRNGPSALHPSTIPPNGPSTHHLLPPKPTVPPPTTSSPPRRTAPTDAGLADSIHAPTVHVEPKAEPPQPSSDPVPHADAARPGLEASIHAPKSVASEPAISSLASTSPPPAFNPAHGRSRTLERQLHAGGVARVSQSGASTPSQGGPQHARTQSSPPTALGVRHARHGSRPVISGDAISRIVRTLGGGPAPKRDPPVSIASAAVVSD